ncbi:MAG: cobalamin-dependent protein [Pirellulaceae bacterium]|nr:cobalamin-dependent protein [Pirellulaceae bacterium]
MTDEVQYRRYFDALLAGEREVCHAMFAEWLNAGIELRWLYEQRVRRSLYEIGELWERGRVSVAVEHLATAITESLLTMTYPRLFARPRVGRSAVVTCVANEYHQIGGKMVADLFELHGWRGYFLGANAPLDDVLKLVEEKRPDAVGLSVTVTFGLDTMLRTARAIRAAFPTVPILVGGQALRWGGRERIEQILQARCLLSLDELDTWIERGVGDV